MAESGRVWRPRELNDAFRLVVLAEGVGADSLDDLKSFRSVRGVSLVPELQGDVLDKVSGIIKARTQRGPDLRRECSQPRQEAK